MKEFLDIVLGVLKIMNYFPMLKKYWKTFKRWYIRKQLCKNKKMSDVTSINTTSDPSNTKEK